MVAINSGAIYFSNLSFSGQTITNDPFEPYESKPPTLPYAGVRTGELIGHRLWWVIDGDLYSLAHPRRWLPGETIVGDTMKAVSVDWATIWGGTYAFMDAKEIPQEIVGIERIAKNPVGLVYVSGWAPWKETTTLVSGTIKMWGDVIEHERGYRAEFAKINSLDAIYGRGDIDALRQRYGVTVAS